MVNNQQSTSTINFWRDLEPVVLHTQREARADSSHLLVVTDEGVYRLLQLRTHTHTHTHTLVHSASRVQAYYTLHTTHKPTETQRNGETVKTG